MRCDDGIIYDDDFLMSDGTGKFVLIDKHGRKKGKDCMSSRRK